MTARLAISVVIPALNEAAAIARTISDVRAAGFDEVLVVDGGSCGATVNEAREADVVLTSPAGRARQQNAGARDARGDVLLFLHADCRPDPRSAAAIRSTLAAADDVIAGCFVQRIDAPGCRYRLLEWGNLQRVLWFQLAYGDQGIFVRRDVFEDIGGFPEWPLMEDVDLMRRLRGRGRFVVLPPPLTVSARRWQKRGVVRQTLTNWTLLTLHYCGVPPARLADFYRHVR